MRTGLDPQQACDVAIARFAERVGGLGAIILVDPRGGAGWARNTQAMSWGLAREGEGSRCGH